MPFADHTLSSDEVLRFSRQLILKGFGPRNQEKLKSAAVLIIGAGGLGCPLATYLTAAGVGRIGIVDHDVVSIDNLHRQIMHDQERVGDAKVDSLKKSLLRLNSDVKVTVYDVLMSSSNALSLVSDYDIVADCSDNVPTRYLVNDACVLSKKPIVSGSALGWEGQMTVYNCGEKCPCYRCIFPVPPNPETVTNCSDAGVLGPIVGIIGSLQALEVIKIIVTGLSSFAGYLWLFDGFEARARTICLRDKLPGCAICGKDPTITELQEYEQFCGSGSTDKIKSLSILSNADRISVKEFDELRKNSQTDTLLVDVRPSNEFEICRLEDAKNFPLEDLKKVEVKTLLEKIDPKLVNSVSKSSGFYVICHRGNDSQLAVNLLKEKMVGTRFKIIVKDIIGGLDNWAVEVDKSFPRY